jgi:hypothetical protein
VSQILASEEEGVAVSSEEVEMEAALKEDTALKEGADALLKDEGVEAGEEVPLIPLPVEGASNKAKTAVEEEKAMAEEEAKKATAEQVAAAKAEAAEKAATVEKAEEEVVVLEEAAATAAEAEASAEERTHDLARRKSENLADKAQNLARLKEKDEVRGSRPSSYVSYPSFRATFHAVKVSAAAVCAVWEVATARRSDAAGHVRSGDGAAERLPGGDRCKGQCARLRDTYAAPPYLLAALSLP